MKYYKTKIGNMTLGDEKITKKYYVIYESLWHSIFSDLFTFGMITFAFWYNHSFIGSRAFSILLFIAFFVNVTTAFNDKKIELEPKEFIKTIEKELFSESEEV